jgi:hypothetical protein
MTSLERIAAWQKDLRRLGERTTTSDEEGATDWSAGSRDSTWPEAVPAHAQALIRALLIERAGDNVNPQAPLFTGRGDSRISEHAMRGMLRSVARKTAIALPTRNTTGSLTSA